MPRLIPNNKNLQPFKTGNFFWGWLLSYGVGLPIKYGKGLDPARYYYDVRGEDKGDPHYGNGYPVSEDEARAMALCAKGVVQVEKLRGEAGSKIPEDERNVRRKLGLDPGVPVRADYLEYADKFADWAEQCGGFKIEG